MICPPVPRLSAPFVVSTGFTEAHLGYACFIVSVMTEIYDINRGLTESISRLNTWSAS